MNISMLTTIGLGVGSVLFGINLILGILKYKRNWEMSVLDSMGFFYLFGEFSQVIHIGPDLLR